MHIMEKNLYLSLNFCSKKNFYLSILYQIVCHDVDFVCLHTYTLPIFISNWQQVNEVNIYIVYIYDINPSISLVLFFVLFFGVFKCRIWLHIVDGGSSSIKSLDISIFVWVVLIVKMNYCTPINYGFVW